MPAHDRVGRDDLDSPSPVRPQARHQHPDEAVGGSEVHAARRLALEHGELMPERKNLHLEFHTRPNGRPESGQEGDEQRGHSVRQRYQPRAQIRNRDKSLRVFGRDSCRILRSISAMPIRRTSSGTSSASSAARRADATRPREGDRWMLVVSRSHAWAARGRGAAKVRAVRHMRGTAYTSRSTDRRSRPSSTVLRLRLRAAGRAPTP